MSLEVSVADHQEVIEVASSLVDELEAKGLQAALEILSRYVIGGEPVLGSLTTVEVALVDDATSDQVHREFMDIAGATDVITFEHGEIVIGIETAKRQAAEYGEPLGRELFRYLVHGLLHLAGHEDGTDADRQIMEVAQETLVERLWGVRQD